LGSAQVLAVDRELGQADATPEPSARYWYDSAGGLQVELKWAEIMEQEEREDDASDQRPRIKREHDLLGTDLLALLQAHVDFD